MWLICLDDDWLLIDAGSAYPKNEMLGIDMVIPKMEYLEANASKIRGIVLTHAHFDHIGSLPYLLSEIPIPVYGSPLTIAMARYAMNARFPDLVKKTLFETIQPDSRFRVGSISCELLRMTHDVPDNCGVAVQTKQGWIVFTGDFKVDYTPHDGKTIDLARLGEMGREGVLCLLSDSSNAELQGSTYSERAMELRLEKLIHEASDRLVVHVGSNDLVRIQQLFWLAEQEDMSIQIQSELLKDMIQLAQHVNAISLPESMKRSTRGRQVTRQNKQRQMIITTSSQSEPFLSSLMNIGGRNIIQPGDTVLLTGSTIPGSEKTQIRIVNNLYRQGASHVEEALSRGQYSSHAAQDELKLILTLTKPQNFIPIHGELRQLRRHAELAVDLGFSHDCVFLPSNGDCLQFTNGKVQSVEEIPVGSRLIDGLGSDDIGAVVLRDRKQLSEDGLVIAVLTITRRDWNLVCPPEIVTKGFVYEPDSEELFDEVRQKLSALVQEYNGKMDWSTLKNAAKDFLSKFIFERTHRRPVILPMILEVKPDNVQ